MLEYKFYFDGELVENPVAWEDMVTTIKRDRELKGEFITLDATLTFTKDGQEYLWNLLQEGGWCSTIELQVLESRDAGNNFRVFYDGIIKLSDVEFMGRQVNLEETIIVEEFAKCKVLDNSFFSHLETNKKLKTNLFAGKSKNGVDITPCPIKELRLFNPVDGSILPLTQFYGCVRLDDALRYLVAFATDDRVDYESTLFGTGGEFEDVILTYGIPIRETGAGNSMTEAAFIADFPQLDFQTVFSEANFINNIGINVDYSGQRPKFIIGKYQDLFRENAITQISNIDRIVTKIKTEEIFSRLIIGSDEILDSSALSFPELIPWVGVKREEYFILGDCNVDREFEIVGSFIRSSNIIEKIAIDDPTNEDYDEKVFIIDAEFNTEWYDPIQGNWLTTGPPYFYNERFTNSNIANRFLGAVPNNIASLLGPPVNTEFRASLLPNNDAPHPTPIGTDFTKSPCVFNNDSTSPNFNPSNSYSTVTNRFTAPATGVFSFSTSILTLLRAEIVFSADFNITWHTRLIIKKYDAADVLIGQYTLIDTNDRHDTSYGGNFVRQFWVNVGRTYSGSVGINMNATDYVEVEFEISDFFPNGVLNVVNDEYDVWILKDSFFACAANQTSGGTFTTYDPNDYPIIVDSFEQELSKKRFDLILADPLSLIEYSQGARSFKRGWIDELKYNHFTGIAQFKLLTTKSGQPEIDVPCLPTYGANIFDNNDFSDGATNWGELQDPANWTIDNTGAVHIPPGSASPLDAIQNTTSLVDPTSPSGKYRVTVTVSGMTAGSFFVLLGGYAGVTNTTNGTFIETIDTGVDTATDIQVVVSPDFDGKIEYTEVRAIITC